MTRAVPDYRHDAGLPDGNAGDRLVIGRLVDASGVVRGHAQRYYSERQGRWLEGGLPEYFVPNPRDQIRSGRVVVLDPPY